MLVAIVTLVIEQECKAYENPLLSSFTAVCCWQVLLFILFLLLVGQGSDHHRRCSTNTTTTIPAPPLPPTPPPPPTPLPKLDSKFTSGNQAILLSALLCMANVALVVTIFVKRRACSLKSIRARTRERTTTDASASSVGRVANDGGPGGGDVEMTDNPMGKLR